MINEVKIGIERMKQSGVVEVGLMMLLSKCRGRRNGRKYQTVGGKSNWVVADLVQVGSSFEKARGALSIAKARRALKYILNGDIGLRIQVRLEFRGFPDISILRFSVGLGMTR